MQKRWNFTLHSYARAHRTERSHSSFQCAWKESAELGHQMSKKLRFFVRPSWPRPEQKNHQSLEKMCFVQNSETYIKNVLKAILSSKDMNKYLIRPPICKIHKIRCFSYHFFQQNSFDSIWIFFWWQFISAPLCLLSKVWNGEGVSIEFCSIRGEMRRANDILACYSLLISHFRRLW